MLFNEEVFFIHPVKTGGMSLTHFFLGRLKGPIFYVAQKGHHGKYRNWRGVYCLIGNRHGNLPYASAYLKQFENFSLDTFKTIISVIRNPYTLEVSRFFYFAKDIDWIDPGALEVTLARQGDFETFAKEAPYNYCTESGHADIQHYYTLDGKIPNNLSLLRCESLEDDLEKAFSQYKLNSDKTRGFRDFSKRDIIKRPIQFLKATLSILNIHRPCKLPELNRTKKNKSLQDLLTPAAELAIYNKYNWVFDNGYYNRITL